ncbi:Hyalin [Symbiodinium sp. CCMP2456]|nr:Hyalin [Symbiodinium sp. CCMP2456]
MTHKGDFSAAQLGRSAISDSGTAFVELMPSFLFEEAFAVDELASCNAAVHEELPTDEGQCTSSQIPLNDTCIPGINYTCSPAQLPLGTSQVSCESSDGYTYNFETEVKDTGPPLVSKNFSDVLEVATCGRTAHVTFVGVEASDNCDTVTPTCAPASGSLFSLGTTDVTCTAQDLSGNDATPMTFQVTVGDTTPPVITQLTDTNVTTCGVIAQVAFEVEVSDNCDNVVPICAPASGSLFLWAPQTSPARHRIPQATPQLR